MSPDEKTEHRDGQAGEGDKLVAEDPLAREARDQLADHTHSGQDHDVDGRMRIEPEEMLEEKRIAAPRGIENPQVKQALDGDERQRDGQNRRPQDKNNAGGVMRPYEQRKAEPRHAWSAHLMDGDDEVEAGQNR